MASYRVITVRTGRRRRRPPRHPARRDRRHPGRDEGLRRVPRRRREGAPPKAAANPRLPGPRPDRPAVRDHRPGVGDGPRPGDAHRARRRRVRRALRDRRPRRLRHARRPGRRGGQPARRDALRRRLQGAAAPEGRSPRTPARCCPTRSARPCVWTIRVDATGEGTDVDGRARAGAVAGQAVVRRRAGATSTPAPPTRCSRCCGRSASCGSPARRPAAGSRCRCPSRRSWTRTAAGAWSSARMLPVESWNAQISLLTGFAAASLMVYARVGLLRTLPPADPRDVQRLHRTARALEDRVAGRACSTPTSSARSTSSRPNHAAMVVACTRLLRGSGYVGFNGELPEQPQHSALASEYAHVTAPLRRLVDRYALRDLRRAVRRRARCPTGCWPSCRELPDTMRESGRRANQYENAVLNLVEAAVLAPPSRRVVPGRRRRGRREGRPPRRRDHPGPGRRGRGHRLAARCPSGRT